MDSLDNCLQEHSEKGNNYATMLVNFIKHWAGGSSTWPASGGDQCQGRGEGAEGQQGGHQGEGEQQPAAPGQGGQHKGLIPIKSDRMVTIWTSWKTLGCRRRPRLKRNPSTMNLSSLLGGAPGLPDSQAHVKPAAQSRFIQFFNKGAVELEHQAQDIGRISI